MQQGWKQRLILFWRGWGFSILIAILIATSFKSAIADWNDIPSGSMEPTILPGDRVFVNKLAYDLKLPYTTVHIAKWSAPERGDIVVFFSPQDGKRLIKRVVGIPGDVIGMKKNHLYINSEDIGYFSPGPRNANDIPEDRYPNQLVYMEDLNGIKHPVLFSPFQPSRQTFGPITIPEGKYLMLGDNRDRSADSRFFGLVDRNRIVGRATIIVISREGNFLHPRFDRFFKDLI